MKRWRWSNAVPVALALLSAACATGTLGAGPGSDTAAGDPGLGGADGAASSDGSGSTDDASASDPNPPETPSLVHMIGRFDTRDPGGPRFAWTYSGFWARLSGKALDLAVAGSSDIRFRVVIDGTPGVIFKSTGGAETVHVAHDLTTGEHDVEVFRDSEALFGDSQFAGFTPGSGAALVLSLPKTHRRLEVIGDSISAGYGNEGCPFSTDTQNGYLTYGAIAARAVNAEPHIIAWSGIGMYRNYDGATTDTMPDRYGTSLAYDAASTWDYAAWIPDAIVINLGTNDFSSGDPGQPFVTSYVSFVERLRGYYPNALFLCVSMTDSGFDSTLDSIVTAIDDVEVKKLTLTVPAWAGCDGHPDLAADANMADQLATRLRSELGW
jgi:lysophospholipase L1-like esterase